MNLTTIGTRIEVSAAHRLNLPYDSPCNTIHGHNYIIEIELSGEVNKNGMVADFGKIKKYVRNKFDHKILSLKVPPTAENMATIIAKDLSENFNIKPFDTKVRVYETEHNWAEVVV